MHSMQFLLTCTNENSHLDLQNKPATLKVPEGSDQIQQHTQIASQVI